MTGFSELFQTTLVQNCSNWAGMLRSEEKHDLTNWCQLLRKAFFQQSVLKPGQRSSWSLSLLFWPTYGKRTSQMQLTQIRFIDCYVLWGPLLRWLSLVARFLPFLGAQVSPCRQVHRGRRGSTAQEQPSTHLPRLFCSVTASCTLVW